MADIRRDLEAAYQAWNDGGIIIADCVNRVFARRKLGVAMPVDGPLPDRSLKECRSDMIDALQPHVRDLRGLLKECKIAGQITETNLWIPVPCVDPDVAFRAYIQEKRGLPPNRAIWHQHVVNPIKEIAGRWERFFDAARNHVANKRYADGSSPFAAPPTIIPSLSQGKEDILTALHERKNLTKTNLAHVVGLQQPHGHFCSSLRELKNSGFIGNRNDRKGYFLTEKGREYVDAVKNDTD